jgi:gluconolactonase
VELFCDRFRFPNGVCLSPDQQLLYCCSTKPFEKHVLVYDRESLQFLQVIAEENSDGIKCDGFGNLYLCTNEGVVILNRDGKRLGIIHLPTQPANAAWGGDKKNDLLITARQNIFLIRNLQK